MYELIFTNRFKKSLKRCRKRGLDIDIFREAVNILQSKGKLPAKYKPHKLAGKYKGYWECHLKPDWLLVWVQSDDKLILLMIDIGTHSDLF